MRGRGRETELGEREREGDRVGIKGEGELEMRKMGCSCELYPVCFFSHLLTPPHAVRVCLWAVSARRLTRTPQLA